MSQENLDSGFPYFPKTSPIPPIFHSLLKDGPFTHCIDCNKEIYESGEIYMIERVFRGTEPIVECAMCMSCRSILASELSDDSKQRIEAYFDERVIMEDRVEQMWTQEVDSPEHWIDHCLITKNPRSECNEYQIMAICQGKEMSIGPAPFMICGAVSNEVGKLLSKKTRERLGDFTETHFGMPPEFCSPPKSDFHVTNELSVWKRIPATCLATPHSEQFRDQHLPPHVLLL